MLRNCPSGRMATHRHADGKSSLRDSRRGCTAAPSAMAPESPVPCEFAKRSMASQRPFPYFWSRSSFVWRSTTPHLMSFSQDSAKNDVGFIGFRHQQLHHFGGVFEEALLEQECLRGDWSKQHRERAVGPKDLEDRNRQEDNVEILGDLVDLRAHCLLQVEGCRPSSPTVLVQAAKESQPAAV